MQYSVRRHKAMYPPPHRISHQPASAISTSVTEGTRRAGEAIGVQPNGDVRAIASIARDNALDAARGILMMLGIFLHAANIYSVNAQWVVTDTKTHVAFDTLGSLIHVFRMPAFFWIAGYFCAMVYQSRGPSALFQVRIPRLVFPLCCALILLNIPQLALLGWIEQRNPWAFFTASVPVLHLWFLVDLIVITLVAGTAGPTLDRWIRRFSPLNTTALLILLVLLSYGLTLTARASGVGGVSLFGLTTVYRVLIYLPYFLAGLVMFHNIGIRESFYRVPIWMTLVAVPAAYHFSLPVPSTHRAIAESALILELLFTWISVAAVLNFFQACFQQSSAITRYLSDSAYSVYLFHHPIVVYVGLALLPLAISPWVKYVVVCLVTIVATWAIHRYFVKRFRWASLMFNGK